MTDKERLDLMMGTNLSKIVSEDFLKWLGGEWLFRSSGKHQVPRKL